MRRASVLLTVALLLSCVTPGETKKEPEAPPPRPISGKVTASGAPAPGARVVVTRHRPGLGAEPPCACEDHPAHALALCLAPESSEKMAALARTEPEAAPVAEVTTGPDGEFTTPPLPEGRYDLRAELREGLGWKAQVGAGARSAEVSLRATAPIRGQVRTAGGAEVVGGAEIVVSAGDARIVRVAVANAAGDFEVPGVPLGGALVIASTPGLTPAKGLPAPAAAEDGSLGFTPLGFQLRPRVTLRGAVTRAGQPVSSAEVLAHSDCRTYRTRTDAAGKFELSNLPARDYPVSAVSGFEGAQVMALLEAPGPLALELQKGGVLAGQVKDARGPLAGAEVVAIPRQPRGADEIRRVRTHRDGSFELGPMLPGKWQVEVIAAGHLSRPPAEIRVAEGARQPLEVELAQATHIAGSVLGDTGTGLPDAEVEAVRSDADPGCVGCRLAVRTGPDGSFQLYPLAAGEYTVRATHDRYLGASAKGVKPTDDLKLTLTPGAGLRGTIQDPDQPGAIHAAASLRAADGTAVRPPRLVDPNGTFLLEGLTPGEYTLVVESADALPRRAETAVTVAAGVSAGVDVALKRGTSVSGKVVDDAGQPVAGATVQVAGGPGQGMAVVPASADGTFELKRLPPGKLRLSASREGFLAGPRSIAAADTGAGGTRRVTLALSRLPAVKGRVRVPAGAAVDEVWVNDRRMKLDDQRRFRTTLLRPGKQVVVVEAAGYAPAPARVDAGAGREVDVKELALSAGRTVEGQVLDPEGKPLARAAVLVVDPALKDALQDRLYGASEERPPLAASLTDASGKFRFEHAPAGAALLLVRHPLHLSAEVAVPAGQATATARLQAGGAVVGKVLDAGGDPVRGTVVLVPAGERGVVYAGTVSDAGRFGFGGLPAGAYAVAVSALPSADGSVLVFDPAPVEVKGVEVTQVELRERTGGARVTVQLQVPEALGGLSARLLPADALGAPAQSLYRRLFVAMPAEQSIRQLAVFRHAPSGPRTLVLLRELGREQIGLDRRPIEVPASGEITVKVDQVKLETVLRDEGG